MIGHQMNGHVVLACAPSTGTGEFVILAAAQGETFDPYVVAKVSRTDVVEGSPTEWYWGDYFRDLKSALKRYTERTAWHPPNVERSLRELQRALANQPQEVPA